jgi:hypothetical protein
VHRPRPFSTVSLVASCFILGLGSGCGVIFQTISGFDRDETRIEQVEQPIEIASLPAGAEVIEVVGDQGRSIGTTPLRQQVSFEREVTLRSPASMSPFWLGTIVDGLVVAGSAVAVGIGASHLHHIEDRRAAWAVWGVYVPSMLISEVIVGFILANRETSIVGRHDRHTSHEFALRKPGYPMILARVDVPAVSKLTVPLDASAALRLNQPGSPAMLMFARGSTLSVPLEER